MATKIVELITMRTAKLSAESQRTKAADRDVQPNLALLFAGEYDRDHSADVSPGPFALQERFSSSLWMENGLYIVRNGVRVLLNKLADATISLAMEGTGESSVDDSFWVDGHMNGFSPEWNDLIRKEVDSLLKILVDASRRDEARRKIRGEGVALTQDLTADFDSTRLSLSLGREAVLRVRMIPEIEIRRPEFGDRIFCELEKAIKNLAFSRPECTMRKKEDLLDLIRDLRVYGESFYGARSGKKSLERWRK
ncbi:unnamed protein product [Rhizoctonia solani]|uniref:Uncharacterized protein n=1 Tax=Rhizoctonia solani TaxID=456999 RepID=A0A8H2W9S3_9AGAM|nr:unnamed protein product [Rhizoctonia solani]